MTNIHDLKTIVVNGMVINCFYKRERNDYYGNARYRVYIIDVDKQAVTERIANTYNVEQWIFSFYRCTE